MVIYIFLIFSALVLVVIVMMVKPHACLPLESSREKTNDEHESPVANKRLAQEVNAVGTADYDESTTCPCKNGGVCALDDDFCVCKHGFNGRYCEVDLRDDPEFQMSCANLYHGEVQNHECASCRCYNQVLTCTAYMAPVCAQSQRLKQQHLENKKRQKSESLVKLLDQVSQLERSTYETYINFYKSQMSFKIKYLDVNELELDENATLEQILQEDTSQSSEVTHRRLDDHHDHDDDDARNKKRSSGGHQSTSNLVVLTSNSKITGLFFPQQTSAKPMSELTDGERFIQKDREQTRQTFERYYSFIFDSSSSSASQLIPNPLVSSSIFTIFGGLVIYTLLFIV